MLGLALEGGGAKGAFHMGVVKAFLEEGYQFGGVTGTSIGALNGAIIAQGDFEAGYKLWENMKPSLLFNIEEEQYKKLVNMELDKTTAIQLASKVKNIIDNKGIDTAKMLRLLEDIIDEEKLRKSQIDFGLVTVSLSDLKPLELYKEDIPEGMIIDYLMASASFPGFKLKQIEDKYYIDGGFYDNCPINLLAKKGYKEIVAVRTLGIGIVQNIKYSDVKVTNIVPSEGLGKILDFNNDLVKRNLQMGYYDAMRKIRNLAGIKYYIKPVSENSLFNILSQMPDEAINSLKLLLEINEMAPKRMLFEKIVPKIAEVLGLQSSTTYHDVIVGLLERLAEEKGVHKYEIYSFNDFLDRIKSLPLNKNSMSNKINFKLPVNVKFISSLSKKHIIILVAQEIFDSIYSMRSILE